MKDNYKVAIVGGGAAGFFSALMVKHNYPESTVILYEKTNKLLAKVAISGGGRCNVTNGSSSIKELSSSYPRGKMLMKKLLPLFSTKDIISWFENREVPLKVEADNRVFPVSNNSKSIVDCLLREANLKKIEIRLKHAVSEIVLKDGAFQLKFKGDIEEAEKVIIATGGSPKRSGLDWLSTIGHSIIDPLPSLFTFNMPNSKITELMGVSAPNVIAKIEGTKLTSEGPLLITHWGLSGPAILRLSAFGARILSELNYHFKVRINWTGIKNYDLVLTELSTFRKENAKKQIANARPFSLPDRLWLYFLNKTSIKSTKIWGDAGIGDLHKMVSLLTNDDYEVKGKTTFKEEFVTSGGVSLDSVRHSTLESKSIPGIFFAGEILDIDGITGGYNFQAAWTTAFIAGKLGKLI